MFYPTLLLSINERKSVGFFIQKQLKLTLSLGFDIIKSRLEGLFLLLLSIIIFLFFSQKFGFN